MAGLRTLIVDDEPIARQLLQSALQKHPLVDLIGESENGLDAISAIRDQRPDLVLIDIQMPGADAFQVIDSIPADIRPAIIFVTAFDQYATKAFRVHAVDYLLKPVEDDLLMEAVDRIASQFATPNWNELRGRLNQLIESCLEENAQQQWFLAKQGDRRIPLQWQDVEWFEPAQNYVRAHVQGKVFLIRRTLRELEHQLTPAGFVRVHRSALVNLGKIVCLQPCGHGEFEIELASGRRISLSRRYRHRLEAIVGRLA